MSLTALLAELYPVRPVQEARVTVVVIDPLHVARFCTQYDARFIRRALERGAGYARRGRGEG